MDQIFRLRSLYAEQRKVPKDILVNFIMKKMKDEIWKLHFTNPIEYTGGESDYTERVTKIGDTGKEEI